jgi:hypothetical protein
MRLGDDALVLTKSARTFSVGLLSQTYNANQPTVKAPIITRFKDNYQLDLSVNTEVSASEPPLCCSAAHSAPLKMRRSMR